MRSYRENPYRLWHGTPYGGFDSFADYKGKHAFFAPDEAGARQYSRPGSMLDSGLASQRRPAGVTSSTPTVYEVDVDVAPERVFDTRREDHRAVYDEIRSEARASHPNDPDEWLPKDLVRTVGPDRRWWGNFPGFGTAMELIPYLRRRGFQAVITADTGGASFLLFDDVARTASIRAKTVLGNPDEEFTPEETLSFMGGDCWLLAAALHEVTGLPIFGASDGNFVHHAFVMDEDSGLAIDHKGRKPVRELLAGCRGDKVVRLSDRRLAYWAVEGARPWLTVAEQRDRRAPRNVSHAYSDEEWDYALEVAEEIAGG